MLKNNKIIFFIKWIVTVGFIALLLAFSYCIFRDYLWIITAGLLFAFSLLMYLFVVICSDND